MNKTVNINLSGIVFHIDEDAFEILSLYLDTLKKHFSNEEGADEILKDIEARIAELFTERLKGKEVVSTEEVNQIISIMGNPSDYDEEIEEDKQQENYNKEEDLLKGKRKRIFRDNEDRMVGGVASGLSHYFNTDPLWIRLIFLIILFTGGGFIIYLIFWIAIPEAKTTAEKLEMKGEKVNINNIEKNIKDELNNISKKVDEFTNHPKTKKYGEKARTITQNITDFFISLFKGIAKFVGSCLGVSAIGIGVLFFVIVSAIFFSDEGLHFGFYQSPYLNLNDIENTLFYGLLLFFGIPIIAVILTGLRLLFNTRVHQNYKVGMLILWIVSWILIGSSIKDNKYGSIQINSNNNIESVNIEQDTVFVYLQEKERIRPFKRTKKGYKIVTDSIPFENTNITLDITKAELKSFVLNKKVSGYRFLKISKKEKNWIKPTISVKIDTITEENKEKQDLSLEESVNYNYVTTSDEIILNDFFTVKKESRWNIKEIDLELRVPLGRTIYLDHSLNDFIYDIQNVDDMWDYDMLGHYWKMEKKGLTCVSCDE